MPTRSLSDIEAIEAQSISSRALPESTYEALLASAKRNLHAKALTFFRPRAAPTAPTPWTYAEFIAEATRAANTFHTFGVTSDYPVAFVLPNLPETHFTIWTGESGGARAKSDRVSCCAYLASASS